MLGLWAASRETRDEVTASADARDIIVGHAVPADGDGEGRPKTRIMLLPLGEVRLRDGRTFRVDGADHARAIIAASLAWAGGTDIPIDYDHQLVFAVGKGKGGQAPAAGWIKALEADAEGIWASVDWTPAATAALTAGEYRYISPAFHDDAGGRVTRIVNAGLVNLPAITDLPAVAATQEPSVEPMKQIAAALGLPDTATLDEIIAAIGKMATPAGMDMKVKAAATALGLAEGADLDAVVTAATALAGAKPDPAKFVPIEALQTVNAELRVLQDERIDRIVTAACEAGKITPALKSWATDLARADLAKFQAYVDAAPAVIGAGIEGGDPATAAANQGALTSVEAEAARRCGLTPEQYLAAKA